MEGFNFNFDFSNSMDFELDFDLGDFDFDVDGSKELAKEASKKAVQDPEELEPVPQEDVRILKPKIDVSSVCRFVSFANAEEFARQISLESGDRTFAWVSGSFIFGDIIEALMTARNVGIKKLHITSLSFSQENIDSLKNVMLMMGDELERLVLVLSGYQYSHEKFNLVPYMYEELDDERNIVQIAFGGWHCKIVEIETSSGHTISIHGSANLRSSNSIEQIMVEIDNKELHQFNVDIMERIAERFGTINYKAPHTRLKRIEGRQAWELSEEAVRMSNLKHHRKE